MPEVRIAERRVWVASESRALLSGEVHYWRLDPERWRGVLEEVRHLGFDVVSTYVCWDFHELDPGRFDFDGATHPARNLLRFLDLADELGFWVLIRPGPYIYAEWPNSGIPERVVMYHRLHPAFVAEASVWMAAVVEALAARQATRGGPIVLWQADNEADPWVDVYERQLGLASAPGAFQEFLRRRYEGDLELLNGAWGTRLPSFESARVVTRQVSHTDTERNRLLDFARFRHTYTTEIVRWTTDAYRSLGVDVPIYTNSYASFGVQDWRLLEAACDLSGPDVYPSAGLHRDGEHRVVLDAMRYARTYSRLPFIPELQAGIWHGWHYQVGVLTPRQYELTALSALLAGVAGWSWYMLVGRDNWYMSPLTELGRPRPELAPTFGRLVELFRALDPPSLEKLTETAAAINVLEQAAGTGDASAEAVLEVLYQADLDHEMYDPESGQVARRLLVYAGGRWLSEAGQTRLRQHVEQGGLLVFFQTLPVLDDRMRPLNRLEVREPAGVLGAEAPRRLRLRLGDGEVTLSSAAAFMYDEGSVPGEPIVGERVPNLAPTQEGGQRHLQLLEGERIVVGYRERRGRGQLVVLGVQPTPELMVAMHRWLEVPFYARAEAPNVSTAVFRARDGAYVLVAVNVGDDERDAVVVLDGPDLENTDLRVCDLLTGGEDVVSAGRPVRLRLPRKSGTAARLVPL